MRRSLHDCHGQRGYRLRVQKTVCDVVLHRRFLLRNGGHYTTFCFYLTRIHAEKKVFENQLFTYEAFSRTVFGMAVPCFLQATSGAPTSRSHTKITQDLKKNQSQYNALRHEEVSRKKRVRRLVFWRSVRLTSSWQRVACKLLPEEQKIFFPSYFSVVYRHEEV